MLSIKSENQIWIYKINDKYAVKRLKVFRINFPKRLHEFLRDYKQATLYIRRSRIGMSQY